MTTFSELVDSIVAETKRPDLRAQIAGYLNQTIRELHFEPQKGNVVFYWANRREVQVTVDSLDRQVWRVPDVAIFQGMAAARFDNMYTRDHKRVYAQELTPGPRMELEDHYFYRAADTYVFGGVLGCGGIGSTISLSYFEYPRGLKYYALADRPATYDLESGWSYKASFDISDEERERARSLVTNWLLERWDSTLQEGLRAKVYKRVGDDTRAARCYSLFMQMRQGVFSSEIADVGIPY